MAGGWWFFQRLCEVCVRPTEEEEEEGQRRGGGGGACMHEGWRGAQLLSRRLQSVSAKPTRPPPAGSNSNTASLIITLLRDGLDSWLVV